jgi:cell division protein FtsB
MRGRWLTWVLLALLAWLQYPLWIGNGGWLRAWDTERKLDAQKQTNAGLEARNAALDAEVRDLKQGLDAIEEQARYELGLIKQGEVFVQIPVAPPAAPPKDAAPR